jgi:YbbR domain-containing protein
VPGFGGFDLGRLLLALALAAALWWVITTEQNPERIELFPTPISVQVVNAPPDLVVTGDIPTVQAQVRAPSEVWSRLRASSFRATVDASRAVAGGNQLEVVLEPLDPAVRGAEPVPPRITAFMEERTEQTIPVRVNLTGAVPFGFSSGQALVTPDRVLASGPASSIQRVQEALVEIPLDQLTLSVNNSYEPIPVDARRERVSGLKLTPAVVRVEVPVNQQVSYKEVGIRPVIRGKLAAGYYLEPVEINPPSATLVGEPAQLASVTAVETEPIDINGLSSTAVRQVGVRAPQGLSFLQQRPVTVTLRVSPIQTTQTLQVSPVLIGVDPSLRVTDPLPPVELAITGPAPTLQGLSARDFRVVADLTGRGAGQHTVSLQAQVPQGFRLESLSPASVNVSLRALPTPTPPPVATAAP